MNLKRIYVFENKNLFFKGNRKYFPAIYKSGDDLYLQRFDRKKFDKFTKPQLMQLTGISELDLSVAGRKDLSGKVK